jgi:hypothetical protein
MALLNPTPPAHSRRANFFPAGKVRTRNRRFFFAVGVGLLLFGFGLKISWSQPVSHEYPLKAVFLLNFAQFTNWPTNAFAKPDSPFVVGVLGRDPFGPVLDAAVQNEVVNGRKFVVERYLRIENMQTCHILFISQSEVNHLDRIVDALKDRPVLTVSEIDGAANRGMCVRFITENNKIHLRINPEALQAAQLTMSSKILRLAELVGPTPK